MKKTSTPILSLCILLFFVVTLKPNLNAQRYWSVTGNAGTIAGTNFIGTTDANALMFKVNNQTAGYLGYDSKSNLSFGFQALNSGSGKYNSAYGYKSLAANTSGAYNTATGINSLITNTKGSLNTATGSNSMTANTTGNYNVASGAYTLGGNTTADYNTADGYASLFYNTSGSYNTASGSSALYYNSTGVLNTSIGFRALVSNKAGAFNTGLGANTDVAVDNLTNATAIGYNTVVDASNKVRIGNTDVTSIGGQVSWSTFSDGRYKTNIKNDVKGLEFIKLLQPVTYSIDVNSLNQYYNKNRKTNDIGNDENFEKQNLENNSSSVYNGFIAQDVEKAAEKINYNFSGVDKPKTKDGLYGLRYSDFVVPLVKAVQELSAQNDSLKENNSILNDKIDQLKNELANIETTLSKYNINVSQSFNNSNAVISSNNDAYIEQNTPNPSNSNTVIKYYLPSNTKNAQLVINDVNGKVLKLFTLNTKGNGLVNISVNDFLDGDYFYSLIVDGKKIDTKKMELIR